MLNVVAQIDEFPKPVVAGEKANAEFFPLIGGAGSI